MTPPPTATTPAPALLRAFAEPTRLRILALVDEVELSVGELSRALGMAQSRVSNQLRVLRDLGLLTERHVGTSTHVRAAFRAALAAAADRATTLAAGPPAAPSA